MQVSIVKDKTKFISGYVFTNDGGIQVPLDPDEVIHFKRFNPTNPYRGKGTSLGAALPIDISTYAHEWQRNFFGNSAMPASTHDRRHTQSGSVRSHPGKLGQQIQGRPKLTQAGDTEGGLKFEAVTPTNRDMQGTEGAKAMRDEILAISGYRLLFSDRPTVSRMPMPTHRSTCFQNTGSSR